MPDIPVTLYIFQRTHIFLTSFGSKNNPIKVNKASILSPEIGSKLIPNTSDSKTLSIT